VSDGASTCTSGLFIDLYQLTMAQAYLEEGMNAPAVFSLFVRTLPRRRNYLLACGLDDALTSLEQFRFSDADLGYLRSLGRFSDAFLHYLFELRFTGSVRAVPEGTPIFAREPLLELAAPLPQAQLVESMVMNEVHLQTVLASKASRVVQAAAGRGVMDFALRRTPGAAAALEAARAFFIAGVATTSNVAAGRHYGLPLAGTMAHSYVQAHDSEYEAFRRFATRYPDTILLVDTYDSLDGVRRVIELARELGPAFHVRGIRLDSGDLADLARRGRRMLDDAGLTTVRIIASGGLDDDAIAALMAEGAPIDEFGVGTSLGVSFDVPALDIAYKLTEYAGRGRMKLSSGKAGLPGPQQVFRIEADGIARTDVLARADEPQPGRALLVDVMRDGVRLPAGYTDLRAARAYAAEQLARLPARLRELAPADPSYPVELSAGLRAARDAVQAALAPP
jgi:nicotinate phosphoribosyltransferase